MAELPTGTVAFLFTDIEGSTQLLKRLRERYGDVLDAQRGLRDGLRPRDGCRTLACANVREWPLSLDT